MSTAGKTALPAYVVTTSGTVIGAVRVRACAAPAATVTEVEARTTTTSADSRWRGRVMPRDPSRGGGLGAGQSAASFARVGAYGVTRSRMRASAGVRLALRWLHDAQAATVFSQLEPTAAAQWQHVVDRGGVPAAVGAGVPSRTRTPERDQPAGRCSQCAAT